MRLGGVDKDDDEDKDANGDGEGRADRMGVVS